jgi:NAD(P)H-dependent flavin oxidoreductase YrpB (nitropropane dioxygenase family)
VPLAPTPFTALVGCRVPIQQAAMGGVTTPALAAAVAGAGALGMLSGTGMSPAAIAADVEAASGSGVVGVGFLMPFLDRGAVEAAAPAARVVECFYGAPDATLVDAIRAGGALAAWQVGSADEAAAAVDAGCDLVVVQGIEAGGHVRGTVPLVPLLDAVRARVTVPLVAAGGIGDGVRVGTRFLAATEADVHPAYRDALFAAGAEDTELTTAFSLAWPDAPHRVLRSCVTAPGADPSTRSPMPPTQTFAGTVADAALYAGTSVAAVHRVQPAAAIVDELVRDAAAVR